MTKLFTLDVKESKIYTIEYEGLEVKIKPLSKREEAKLTNEHTKGKVSILQDRQRKGFRRKESERDEIKLPDVDHVELNIAKAIRTWKEWNIQFESKKVECDKSNIELFFNNYYDSFAVPIMDKLEEQIEHIEYDQDEKGKEEGKP